LLVSNPYLVVARKTMPANDLKGLIAWLKANPGNALVGTAGVGGAPHLGGVLLQSATATRLQFVPYRGGGPYMQDLVAGQIDMVIDNPANSLPQLRAGTIKAYAVTAKSRMAAAPDIPTVDEAGLPGCYLSNWKALWVRRGTPKEIIAKLNAAVVTALADPVVRQRLFELGQEIFPRGRQTPDALADFQKAEIDKWWPVIKAANIKAECQAFHNLPTYEWQSWVMGWSPLSGCLRKAPLVETGCGNQNIEQRNDQERRPVHACAMRVNFFVRAGLRNLMGRSIAVEGWVKALSDVRLRSWFRWCRSRPARRCP